MYPTSRLMRPLARVQSTPAMRAEPLVGRSWPTRTLIAVVLPAPLGPMRPRMSPRPSRSDRPSRAVRSPYFLVRRSITTTASLSVVIAFPFHAGSGRGCPLPPSWWRRLFLPPLVGEALLAPSPLVGESLLAPSPPVGSPL